MKILSSSEMRAVDQATSERFGVPLLDLMEHAGEAVARFVLRELPQCRRILVFCGKGNNGGDGFVAARHLAIAGREVAVLLVGSLGDVHGDARAMLDKLPFPVLDTWEDADLNSKEIRELAGRSDLFLDAVVGTGFRPPLRGLALAARDLLNQFPATPVVAVDLPSGWDADARSISFEGVYRADAVVTFTAPKIAHVFGMLTQGGELTRPGNLKQGPVVVASIGSPAEAVESSTGFEWAGSSRKIVDAPRNPDSNKGAFGHVLVIGGSRGKAGAPAMASIAAMRAGAGLVTAAIPSSMLSAVAGWAPELMTTALEEGKNGEISAGNLKPPLLEPLLEKKSVLAIGPGLGQDLEAVEFFFGLLEKSSAPIVIDADALNALAFDISKLDGRNRVVVLTPHPGEMARLTGLSIEKVQADRESLARDFAVKHHVILVLKGWRTLIAHPDGSIAINTTGNPGLAKGGSGDILTGIVAALLGQYPEHPAEAVNAAVYLHGLAADFAVGASDQHALLAMDTVAHLQNAFRFRPKDPGGYLWLQGLPGSMRAER